MNINEFTTYWESLSNEASIKEELLEVFYHQELYMEQLI